MYTLTTEGNKDGMTERSQKGKMVALVNNKGGVGKTTTAVSLAAGLADNASVLLVDLDAQASASLSLGIARADLLPSSAAVVLGDMPARDSIRSSSVAGLDVLTGHMDLASTELILAGVMGREKVLTAALTPILEDYDFIVLDCPPSLGLLTVNALTAADCFLVPVTAEYLALEGLVNLFEAVDRIKAGIGVAAAPLGILLTIFDHRLNATREIAGMIRGHYGAAVLETEIRINVRLKEAPSFGKTIFDYDAGSVGAECYRQLVGEVLRRLEDL